MIPAGVYPYKQCFLILIQRIVVPAIAITVAPIARLRPVFGGELRGLHLPDDLAEQHAVLLVHLRPVPARLADVFEEPFHVEALQGASYWRGSLPAPLVSHARLGRKIVDASVR